MSRSYEGTGLGLAICRRLAQAMGGDVDLTSVVGEGTTVSVRVPLTRARTPESDVIEAAPRALEGCRVLICDGNPLSQAVIKTVLQPATRGVEVVASCEAACVAAPQGRFDLILTDAATLGAERQARLSALRDIAAAAGQALVVVMTPEVGEDEAGRMLGAGAAQIIRKPITASALADALRAGFERRAEMANQIPEKIASAV